MAAEIGGGRIPITIEGREAFLVPSLEACIEISGLHGGITQAVARLNQVDFETICMVIGAGIEIDGKRLNPTIRRKELPKSIYEAGLFEMRTKAIEFCHVVANGGRLPEDADDEDGEDQDGDPLASPSPNTTESSTGGEQAG